MAYIGVPLDDGQPLNLIPHAVIRDAIATFLALPKERETGPLRVLIYGHSFIHRLDSYMKKGSPKMQNFGFKDDQVVLQFKGIGGAHVSTLLLEENFKIIDEFMPNIVFLQVGTCELSYYYSRPESVGSDIHEFVQEIINKRVERVIVGEVLFRTQAGVGYEERLFNGKVTVLNRYLSAVINDMQAGMFWHHRGFWRDFKKNLDGEDGTHLNELGLYKYFRSLRGAILVTLKYMRPALYARIQQEKQQERHMDV